MLSSARLASDETLKVSEIFASIQGEGPSAGAPALFLRLALCNLRCSWCDTRYTWDFERYSYREEVHELSLETIVQRIASSGEGRLIVTGGEPLLQQSALQRLFLALSQELCIEVETNGTLIPERDLRARVDQWNVSPKLAHAGDREARRIRIPALASLRDTGRAYLKFVLESAADLAEIEALILALDWPKDRILLMPQAGTRDLHESRAAAIAELSRSSGYGFSPRLHVLSWNGERGR